MQLVARDRMREIKLWSKFKKQFDDGSFDTKDVNTHQLNSYHLTMRNKAETLTQGSSQPEVFNVLGQLQSIERIKKENGSTLTQTFREAVRIEHQHLYLH